MNNYPEHAAPLKDTAGFQVETFDDWWRRIGQATFPTVPPDAAHHWIHDHWGGSPYASLKAEDYTFEEIFWPTERIPELLTRWDDFDLAHKQSRAKGAELATIHRNHVSLVPYMLEHGTWPVRPVVLDNRDGHVPLDPENERYALPSGFVLMEGHTRYNIAIHMFDQGLLGPEHAIWMMKAVG